VEVFNKNVLQICNLISGHKMCLDESFVLSLQQKLSPPSTTEAKVNFTRIAPKLNYALNFSFHMELCRNKYNIQIHNLVQKLLKVNKKNVF
jgi:hypothetical protein